MTKRTDKLLLAEQVVEIRHVPCGSFLDVRGFVADYIRESGFLPHWKIDTNVILFRDTTDAVTKEGAFAGYRSVGYMAYDPETRNFLVDRGTAFWRLLRKNQHYSIPQLERFGARTKIFLPSTETFEAINGRLYEALYTEQMRRAFGEHEKDVQFTVELQADGFDLRITGGPVHRKEAGGYFNFASDEFDNPGIFLDIDYYRSDALALDDIPGLLRKAIDLTWKKAEQLAGVVGV